MYKSTYIKDTRIKKGLTTVGAAKAINMDRRNYCKLENGKYKGIPSNILVNLHNVLKLDLYHLLNINEKEQN
jgi:DNA-binding Xre family transcriptional regulator